MVVNKDVNIGTIDLLFTCTFVFFLKDCLLEAEDILDPMLVFWIFSVSSDFFSAPFGDGDFPNDSAFIVLETYVECPESTL